MIQYEIKSTNKFKKGLKRLRQQQNFKLDELDRVIYLLATNQIIPAKYNNHILEPRNERNIGMSYATRCIVRISKNRQGITAHFN